jgi:hypothetical protein
MPIELPSITTDAGVVARLVIVENRTPDHPQYNDEEVFKSMMAMWAVVHNRLYNHPELFGAPHAANLIDIITAPGQFHGFSRAASGEVMISADLQHRIDEVLRIANTGAPGKYYQFIKKATEAAADHLPGLDPFRAIDNIDGVPVTGGGYGWRAANASDPGGRFIPIPASRGG